MLEKLSQNLALLSKDITNPYYVHYLFEALVAFVRISSVNPALCVEIEDCLMPSMQDVRAVSASFHLVLESRHRRVHALHLPAVRSRGCGDGASRVDAALADHHPSHLHLAPQHHPQRQLLEGEGQPDGARVPPHRMARLAPSPLGLPVEGRLAVRE